jgi:hypothetical protein
MLQRLWHGPPRPVESVRPPLQALPIPLDIVHLIIDNYFDHPPDFDTLKALSLTCQALLPFCHAILFRRMRIGWRFRDPQYRIHKFVSDFSPSNTLDQVVTNLRISLPRFSTFALAPGLGRYHHLVVSWRQILWQSSFSHLKTLGIETNGPVPPSLQRHIRRLLEGPSNIHLLDLRSSDRSFTLQLLSSGTTFSTIVYLLIHAEVWSTFCASSVAIFPLLRALTLYGAPNEPPVHQPSGTALSHLEFALPRFQFARLHNLVLEGYSQTLRCLHVSMDAISVGAERYYVPSHHPIALQEFASLERVEITVGFTPSLLPSVLAWISSSVAKIPPTALSAVLQKLQIVILVLHGGWTLADVRSNIKKVEGKYWQDLTSCGNQWPNLRQARLAGYYYAFRYTRGRGSWGPKLIGPYTVEGSTWIEGPPTRCTACPRSRYGPTGLVQ